MTKKELPVQAGKDAVAQPEARTDLDPIAIVTMPIGEDPSVAELVAFRDSRPDLKFAARQAKRLLDESMRIRISSMDQAAASRVAAGLMLVGLSFTALTCIWPSDIPDIKVIDVMVSKIRKKLRHMGVEIETRWGEGYSISAPMKAHVEGIIQVEHNKETAAAAAVLSGIEHRAKLPGAFYPPLIVERLPATMPTGVGACSPSRKSERR
ncbi:hypothetical protein ASE63_05380 [Bosea sp. Root381]|uniref:hypothetical protein n=1 Tax=Bosea sp. Root381 TaxID=1736524 RepID=UPI0006FA0E9F|nr:hypothetical protein [Bosea sp. Root381]KRE09934.1 hypothetical protein ASE63_05380 [Bosea sp. Root381]